MLGGGVELAATGFLGSSLLAASPASAVARAGPKKGKLGFMEVPPTVVITRKNGGLIGR